MTQLETQGLAAKNAARVLSVAGTARKNAALEAITPELRAMAGGAGTWRGTGGMATKLNAAQLCLEAGVDMVIANGARMEALYDIVEGKNVGTRFSARRGALQ